jgi:hypothetical protein
LARYAKPLRAVFHWIFRDLCVLLFGSLFCPVAKDFCTEDREDHKDIGSKESLLQLEPR